VKLGPKKSVSDDVVYKNGQVIKNIQVTIETLGVEIAYQQTLDGTHIGDLAFAWDGTGDDGNAWDPGSYNIRATGEVNGEVTELGVRISANVNSVSIGTDNSILLNVDGVGEVPIEDVRAFL
jgi:flagellar basal-body rod modification protein FlgD